MATASTHRWLMVALLLVVTWLGAHNLDADGIWFDEWWSLYNAGAAQFPGTPLSPVEIWHRVAAEDPWQTPGYPLALAAWGNLTGWTEFSGRALSLLSGLLAVAVVYRLGSDLGGHQVGLMSAAALGLSGWFIFFLHEMRVYMQHALLLALLLLLYVRAQRAGQRARPLLYGALAATVIAFLYTHYFAAIFAGAVLGLHVLTGLSGKQRGRAWWQVTACFVIGGALLLPWLANAVDTINQLRAVPRYPHTLVSLWEMAARSLHLFSSATVGLFGLLALLSLHRRPARPIWLLYSAATALSLVVCAVLSLSEPRYLFGTIPLLALIAGFGAVELSQRGVPAAVVAAIWLGAGLAADASHNFRQSVQNTPPQPLREMAAALAPYLQDDDVTLNLLGRGLFTGLQLHPFDFYFRPLPGRKEIVEIETLFTVDRYIARLREAVGDAPRVWLAHAPRFPLEEWSLVQHLLNEWGYYRCVELADTDDIRLQGFARIDPNAPALRFDSGVRALVLNELTARFDKLDVWLGFVVPPSVPPETYSVALHVLDASGALAAQSDFGLPPAGTACRLGSIALAGVPAGSYDLRLVLYDWRTGERASGVGLAGERDTSLKLGTLVH